ncbi:hypothetical protein ABPG75_009864 [Micractinium tetrahymenae]
MIKAQPVELILAELRRRKLGTWGRKDQLVSRLYGALGAEGRALSKEESAVADAELGLGDIGTVGLGAGGDSGWDSGSDADAAAVAAGELASSGALAENPLLALQSSPAGRFLTELNQERLISNFSSLQLYFLWGATARNGIKLTTTCLARTAKSVWLFDCGEDAQRHLVKIESISWGKLERIFISSLAADNIAGLPGMLCTISAAREKGHEAADIPLHVYGPPGLADYINAMLSVSRTYLEMPVIIHEFSTGPVPDDQLDQLVQVNPRARLYVTRLPPDQLNPEGYYDGEMRPLLSRHTKKRSNSGIDERAGTLPLVLPSPGDPSRTGLSVAELTWTLKMDHEWLVRVFPLRNKQPAFGYLMQEAERAGRLYAKRAKQLGLELNEDCYRLKMGQPVQTSDGRWVQPSQCVGPARRGRRVAFVGSCLDASGFAKAAAAADAAASSSSSSGGDSSSGDSSNARSSPPVVDILVHCMSPPPGAPPGSPRTAVAAAAGAAAAAINAKELVLWQRQAAFAETPEGQDEAFPAEVIEAARAAMGSEHVSLGGCYWCYNPERDPEPAEWPEEWG